ncbi:MAG: DEAD/DEAH box family ATP-dependent RNA helicase [Phycisphaerae bacterium]
MKFQDLRLIEPILRAVGAEGYVTPTPIQLKSIPHVLEGRDLLGCAQTGTGKTAAFALPILQRLHASGGRRPGKARPIRALVLAPTRELAAQIHESFQTYGRHTGLRCTVIFGGVGQNPQTRALQAGVDILVATPGRLLDLMQQGYVELSRVEAFVLDEADNMLDMGFIHDIRRIIPSLPRERQSLLFSATMPEEIRKLANNILKNPVSVAVAPVASTVDTVQQAVYMVDKPFKPALLAHYLNNNATARVLVFARTKHGADKLTRHLSRAGIRAEAIHGNKSQNARNRAMASFKSDTPPVLVATDIAARGLDIDDVSHVINYDLPNVPETYVHRIGRTARAGASGLAVSFCDHEERPLLRAIERLIRKSVPVCSDQPRFSAADIRSAPPAPRPERLRSPFGDPRPRRRNGASSGFNGRPQQLSYASSGAEVSTLEAAGDGSGQACAVASPTGVGHRMRGKRAGRGRRPGRR